MTYPFLERLGQRHVLATAGALLGLLTALPAALAEDYYVLGRVYSAIAPTSAAGEAAADGNLLPEMSPVEVAEKVLRPLGVANDDPVPIALVPRNMVRVRALSADDGALLGSHLTHINGDWFLHLEAGPATSSDPLSVYYVVEDVVTGQQLFRSNEDSLRPWAGSPDDTNVRLIPIVESLLEFGAGGTITEVAPAGQYTGIFTRVGKIEVITEVGGSTTRLIHKDSGLATVPPEIADELHTPRYLDAPFGGNLYLFGAFSRSVFEHAGPVGPVFYKIRIDDPTAGGTGPVYMTAPLHKTRIEVDFGDGSVDASRVKVGPSEGLHGSPPVPTADCLEDGEPVCYRLTSPFEGDNVFWSFPDLLALWPTGSLDGARQLTLEIVGHPGPETAYAFPPDGDLTTLRLELENARPDVDIAPFFDTDSRLGGPRVYAPATGTAVTETDLLPAQLGADSDYDDTTDPICDILNLAEAPNAALAFKLTAHHTDPAGYLRWWYFGFRRNDEGPLRVHIGKRYHRDPATGDPGAMIDYAADQAVEDSTMVATDGFQDRYLYLTNSQLQPVDDGASASCGYRFVIHAATRTTDGYHYLHYDWDDDIHYLTRP